MKSKIRIFLLIAILAILALTACSSGESTPHQTETQSPSATAVRQIAEATMAPTATSTAIPPTKTPIPPTETPLFREPNANPDAPIKAYLSVYNYSAFKQSELAQIREDLLKSEQSAEDEKVKKLFDEKWDHGYNDYQLMVVAYSEGGDVITDKFGKGETHFYCYNSSGEARTRIYHQDWNIVPAGGNKYKNIILFPSIPRDCFAVAIDFLTIPEEIEFISMDPEKFHDSRWAPYENSVIGLKRVYETP